MYELLFRSSLVLRFLKMVCLKYSYSIFSVLLCCISFIGNLQALESFIPNENLERAEELLDATLFDEAISLYQLVLQDPSVSKSNQWLQGYVRVRLAQALFAEKKYNETVSCLSEEIKDSSIALNQTRLYLLALSYRNLGKYEKSIVALEQYMQSADKTHLPYDYQVRLEMGVCLFLMNKPMESRKYFDSVVEKLRFDDDYCVAQIYLSRIDLGEKKWQESEYRLKNLESILPGDSILSPEVDYWHGRVSYELANYAAAAEYFEKSLSRRPMEKAEAYFDTLYHLGRTYFSMGNAAGSYPAEQRKSYSTAEALFIQLTETPLSENAYLALAKVYLALFNNGQEEAAYLKADNILSHSDLFVSLEARAHALLLRAELEKSYEKRHFYLKLLTDESYREASYYSKGWYLRGMNDFQQGKKLIETQNQVEGIRLLEQAAYSFEQAFNLFKGQDPPASALAVKFQAEAYLHQHTLEANLKAYHTLEKLLQNHTDIITALKDPSEIYYLHGFVASLLSTKGEKFTESAKKTLSLCSREFPDSAFSIEVLYLLGCLLYNDKEYSQAEEVFLKIVNERPPSKHTGNAYFWLAKSLAKQQKNSEEIAACRRKVYEEFPESRYAAEAYFSLYSYKSYLQGDRQAIKHLMAYKEKFPDTHFLINADYLMGMDAKRDRKTAEGKSIRKKNMKEAIESFNKAEATFDQLYEAGKLPEEDMHYYISLRYHCILERALANLSIADDSQGAKKHIFLEYAEEVLQHLCNDFKNVDHPLTKRFIQKEPYPRLLEESTYWLSQALIKNQNDAEAEKKLYEMLDHYKAAKITRSYFLSRTFYDLGMMAVRRKEFPTALKFFLLSEDAAKGKFISSDQKIDLWIQQSLCYRELDEMDKAMLVLSKAINDEAISSLRVKAMYLRAELYTLQGRHELARKQLESTSKNSGEWAQKAKQKLNEDYGYQ
jgi:tetratricopeptide (TPR) repeat protein